MSTSFQKYDFWSICLLAGAFVVFTIAIPVAQDKIDSKRATFSDYKFNLQQAALKHSEFIKTYDNGHFLDILLQEKMVSEEHTGAVSKIQDRLTLRCQELLADATIAISTDPGDESDDSISRHVKYRHTPVEELSKIFDSYIEPRPTSIGRKFVTEIRSLKRWNLLLYATGSLLFIIGTFFQFAARRKDRYVEVAPIGKRREKKSKSKVTK